MDLGRTLDELLTLWAQTPASEVAYAIELVGKRAQQSVPALSGRTQRDRDAAWRALAKKHTAVERGILIDALESTVAETLWRIDLLARGPKDPRFSSKVGDFVERPIFNASLPRTTEFWRRVFELLPRLGDPRLRDRGRQFSFTWRASDDLTRAEQDVLPKRFARAMPAIEKAYANGVPTLDPASAARCREVVAAIEAQIDDERAAFLVAQDARLEGRTSAVRRILADVAPGDLLAAVYAAPDDDQPRREYAEALKRRSDPRGEFIALQLANEDPKRQAALLSAHKTLWLGPLAKMIKIPTAVFARGFLDTCELKGTWTQTLDDDPAWSTVRSISLSNAGMIQLARITRPLVIETIEWRIRFAPGPDYGHEAAIAAYRSLALPRLRTVSTQRGDVAARRLLDH